MESSSDSGPRHLHVRGGRALDLYLYRFDNTIDYDALADAAAESSHGRVPSRAGGVGEGGAALEIYVIHCSPHLVAPVTVWVVVATASSVEPPSPLTV